MDNEIILSEEEINLILTELYKAKVNTEVSIGLCSKLELILSKIKVSQLQKAKNEK